METLSLDNPLFRAYLSYVCSLSAKTMVMSLFTVSERVKNKAFANPEDSAMINLKPKVHDDVERVRRAHLNDLENILPFLGVSFAYVMTNPPYAFALNLFRAYMAARITHSLIYSVVIVPQPARAAVFGVGFCITMYMAMKAIMHFA